MTVCDQARRGGRSSPHVTAGSITTHFGITNAEIAAVQVMSPAASRTR
jgi:hypothetical protein